MMEFEFAGMLPIDGDVLIRNISTGSEGLQYMSLLFLLIKTVKYD